MREGGWRAVCVLTMGSRADFLAIRRQPKLNFAPRLCILGVHTE